MSLSPDARPVSYAELYPAAATRMRAAGVAIPIYLGTLGESGGDRLWVWVELRSAAGERATARCWAASVDEACAAAEDHAINRLGGDWAMNDWWGLS